MKGLQEIVDDVRNVTRFSQFFKATKVPLTIPETTPFFSETTEKTLSTVQADYHTTVSPTVKKKTPASLIQTTSSKSAVILINLNLLIFLLF